MNIKIVPATPELQHRMKEQSSSNASDFIRFEDNYLSVVALDNTIPVALLVAKIRSLSHTMDMLQEAFIEVQPSYQRQGIGTALMEKVILWAIENHASQIRAWGEEIRYKALMLWAKLGFTFSQVEFQRDGEMRYEFYVAKNTLVRGVSKHCGC